MAERKPPLPGPPGKEAGDERFADTTPVSRRYLILARMALPPERWEESEGFYHEIELPHGGDRWLMAAREGLLLIRVETKDPQRAMRAILRHKELNCASEVDCVLVPPKEECNPFAPPPTFHFRLEQESAGPSEEGRGAGRLGGEGRRGTRGRLWRRGGGR